MFNRVKCLFKKHDYEILSGKMIQTNKEECYNQLFRVYEERDGMIMYGNCKHCGKVIAGVMSGDGDFECMQEDFVKARLAEKFEPISEPKRMGFNHVEIASLSGSNVDNEEDEEDVDDQEVDIEEDEEDEEDINVSKKERKSSVTRTFYVLLLIVLMAAGMLCSYYYGREVEKVKWENDLIDRYIGIQNHLGKFEYYGQYKRAGIDPEGTPEANIIVYEKDDIIEEVIGCYYYKSPLWKKPEITFIQEELLEKPK